MISITNNKKIIFIAIFFIFLFIFLHFSFNSNAGSSKIRKNASALKERGILWNELKTEIKKEISHFRGETGIVIKDLETGWQILYEKDKLFPSASLVKVPIMASCFYATNSGRLNLEEKIILKDNHKVPGSGLLKNMRTGKEFTVGELIDLMVTESDNTAANILIELLGFDYLNNSFKKMGMANTNLSRKMMDFSERRAGIENCTTADDIAYILDKIYHQELINNDISKKCLGLLKLQKIKDRIPAKLPPDTVVAHKTGLERGICHDAGIVFTDKGNFLICVLTRHKNKTSRLAKKFIAQISFLTYKYSQGF